MYKGIYQVLYVILFTKISMEQHIGKPSILQCVIKNLVLLLLT